MSTEKDKDGGGTPKETPTTHSRKAQVTMIILFFVVALGMIANTWANYSKREQRQAERAAAQAKAEEKGTPRAERTINEFAVEQQQASEKIAANNEVKKDNEKRNAILDTIVKGDSNSTATPVQTKRSLADVEADFEMEERKRVLEAMRGPMGRASGNHESVGSQQAPPTNTLARVDEQISSITANQQGVEQRKLALVERAKSLGIDLPAMVAGRATGAPLMQTSTAQGAPGRALATASTPANSQNFGELGVNRAARDPASSGPKPGEKIIPTGTIISTVLDMDMMSDYAGNWIALLQRPVYDVELENILLPAGTKIVGKSIRATGPNEFIQNRMGAVPLWAIRPDGKRIDFTKTGSMDAAGVAALQGSVDRHFLAQFMGIGAYAIIGLGPSLSNYGSEPQSSRDAFVREATGKSRDLGRGFAEKYLNVVPTQRVFAGTPVKIFVEDDIYVTPWAEVDATHFNIH